MAAPSEHGPRSVAEAHGTAPAPGAPPRVPGYRCSARIGSGGMGEVWEALDEKLERPVALKLLPPGTLVSPIERERFRREALAASRVHHPCIVAVFATGEEDGRPWIAQELIGSGRTLRDRIEELRRTSAIPPDHDRTTAAVIAQVAEALEAAHRAGVVHRDLKPQNILLTVQGTPKVADFGLARLAGESSLSRTGDFLGTWLYASPEHLAAGRGGVDARSDVFCLGITLYECLTLQRPFRGESGPEIAHAILHDDPPEPRSLRPRLAPELAVICSKALAKRPGERYPSMQALAEDLRRFLADEPILALPPSRLDRARRWGRRHPARATALLLGTAALLGLAALEWRTLSALSAARSAQAGEARATARLRTLVEELRTSRDAARSDREVSDEVVRVLSDLFLGALPSLLGQDEPTVREIVDLGAQRLRAGQPESPRARARLLGTLGAVLATLGERDQAEEFLEEALRTWDELERAGEDEALVARAALVNLRLSRGDVEGTIELAAPLVELWRAGSLSPQEAADVLADLGRARLLTGELDEARSLLEESLRLRETHGRADSPEAAYGRSMLSQVDYHAGRYAQGLARLEADVERLRPLLAAGNVIALDASNTRALFLQALGRAPEAEACLLEALDRATEALGADHQRTLTLRTNLATVLEDLGRPEEAEALLLESVDLALARFGPREQESRHARHDLAMCWLRTGRLREAEELLLELVGESDATGQPEDLHSVQPRIGLAHCLWLLGRPAEAAEMAERCLPAIPPGKPLRRQVEVELAKYRLAAGFPAR